jgi:hypothetical protein
MCQQRPWDPYTATTLLVTHHPTLIPTLTITVRVAVVHPTYRANPKSVRPCTLRDTNDPTPTMESNNPDDNEASSPDDTSMMVAKSATIPKKPPPKRRKRNKLNQDTPGRAQAQATRKDEVPSQSSQCPLLNPEPPCKPIH